MTTPSLLTPAFVRLLGSHLAFCFSYSVFLLLPKYMAQAGDSAFSIGLVMAASGLSGALAIPWLGPMLDSRPRVYIFMAGHALMFIAALAFVPVTGSGPATALRALQGLAWAVEVNAGMAILSDLIPPARLGQAMGLFGAMNIFVSAAAPSLMEPLAARVSPRWTYVLSGIVAAVGLGLAARLPPSTTARSPLGTTPPFFSLLRSRGPGTVALVIFVLGLANAATFTFIAPFALDRHIESISPFFVAFTVGALSVRFGAGRLVDRVGARRVALASATAYGLCTAAFALLTPQTLVPVAAIFGLLQGLFFPAVMALVVSISTPSQRGQTLVLANGAFSAGYAAVIPLGLLVRPLGYPGLFVVLGIASHLSAWLLLRVPPAATGPALSESPLISPETAP